MKSKPAPKKNSEPCTATAGGGTLKCVLAARDALGREHTVHTTSKAGRSAPQYTTWSTDADGRIRVIEYTRGKRQSERYEGEPAVAPHRPMTLEDEPDDDQVDPAAIAALDARERAEIEPCGAPRVGVPGGCQLFDGHTGEHFACVHGHAHAWRSGNEVNAWEVCGARWSMHPSEKGPVKLPKDAQTVCVRPSEHDGEHRGLDHIGNHMNEWNGDGATGGVSSPKTKIDFVAEVLGQGELDAEPSTATKEPSLADACAKCGRELGEHDGKKCPKPAKVKPEPAAASVGADRLEHVYALIVGAPGKDALALGRVHRRALKELEQAGRIEWRDDGWYPAKAEVSIGTFPITPVTPDDDRIAPRLTRIGEHDVHPAAALFPMIGAAEWPAFVDDVRTNGQRKKIVRIDVGGSWQILDGRNRLRACLEIGFQPRFRVFGDEPGDGSDPIAFVVSENVQRRHLNETQRAFVGAELVPMYEAQAKERMLSGRADPSPNAGEGQSGKATELAARAVNVGKTSVEAAIRVNRDAAPEVLAAAKDRGELKVSAAAELSTLPKAKQREIVEKMGNGEMRAGSVRAHVRQEKKRDIVRTINEQQVSAMPVGPFRVIVADWPWPYENSDQHEGSRGHIPYPPMSIEQAFAMAPELDKLAHEDGCILGFWTTNAFMPEAVRIVEAWGFSWRTIRTWDKGRDGIGTWCRSRTEHLIIAERGEVEHTLNEVSTLLCAPRREHSRKPDEAMEMFEQHCSGPMLELFAREPRSGWASWGAEVEKFATEAA